MQETKCRHEEQFFNTKVQLAWPACVKETRSVVQQAFILNLYSIKSNMPNTMFQTIRQNFSCLIEAALREASPHETRSPDQGGTLQESVPTCQKRKETQHEHGIHACATEVYHCANHACKRLENTSERAQTCSA